MAAQDLERLVVQLSADIKKYENSLNRAMGLTNKQTKAIESRFAKMNGRISSSFKSVLATSVATVGGALGVREIANYADAWTQAGNKMRAAAQIAGVQTRSLNELKDGANAARADVETYVDLYAKLIRSASGVAKSEQEIATATDIVTKAFKAGGASASEQAAGILQLSQALGSGMLQGDELRSIRENAPLVAKAIADEFGTTIAGLKDLGSEGKLVTDRVFKGILRAQKPIEAAFKQTNATIKDAITRVNNEFTAYIGNADTSAGASRKLVEALQYLADNFKQVGDVVIQFATLLIGALTGRALVGVVAGLGNAVVALGGFLTAVRAGTLAAAGLTAALGPIGIVAGAASAALFLYGDGMSEAQAASLQAETAIYKNAEALDAARKSSEGYTAALRNQIKMQLELVKTAAIANDAAATIATDRALAFRKMTKAMTGTELRFAPLEIDADHRLAEGRALYKQYQQLEQQLAEVDKNLKSGFGGGAGSGDASGKADRLNEYEREIKQIRERTAALQAETAAMASVNPLINDYGYAVEFAAAKQSLLTAAQEAGVKITPELAASIDDLANGYANAVVASEQLAESQDEIRQRAEDAMATAKDVTRGIIDGFVEGASAADMLANSLKRIGDALLDDVLNSIFKVNGAGGGGGLNFLSLLGLGGGGSFPAAPKLGIMDTFSGGGYTGHGGKYQPAGVVHKGEYIFDAEATKRIGVDNLRKLQGYASGGLVGAPRMPKLAARAANDNVSISYAPQIDNRGADSAAVARLEQTLAKDRAELESRIMKVVRERPKRGW